MSKKRTVVPPNKFVDSASEVELDSLPKKDAKCSTGSRKFDQILSKKLILSRQKYDDEPLEKRKPTVQSIDKVNIPLHPQQKEFAMNSAKTVPLNVTDNNITDQNDPSDEVDLTEQDDVTDKDDSERDESSEESPHALIEELLAKDTQISNLKNEIKELRSNNDRIRNLNYNLQEILCNEFGVRTSTNPENQENEHKNETVHVQINRPVGILNRKNAIHLGHGVWIAANKWNSININSGNSASLFARNAARSVFGEEVLKRSSITGKSSNRAAVKETRDKLDSTKITAIQSAFDFWATKKLVPPMSSTNMQHYKALIPTYIGKFCDDLRQPAQKSKKTKKNVLLSTEQNQQKELVNEGGAGNVIEADAENLDENAASKPNTRSKEDDLEDSVIRKPNTDHATYTTDTQVNQINKGPVKEANKCLETDEDSS